MFGFLKDVHDKSESELDDFSESVRREIQSLLSSASPRENRIQAGVASKRLLQRYLNSVNVSDTELSDDSDMDKQIVQFDYTPRFDKAGEEFFTAPEVGTQLILEDKKRQAKKSSMLSKLTPMEREERAIARRQRRATRMERNSRRAAKQERIKQLIEEESLKLNLPQSVIQDRLASLDVDPATLEALERIQRDDDNNTAISKSKEPVSYDGLKFADYFSLLDTFSKSFLRKSCHSPFVNNLDVLLTMIKLRLIRFSYYGKGGDDKSGDNDATNVYSPDCKNDFFGITLEELPIDSWFATFLQNYVKPDEAIESGAESDEEAADKSTTATATTATTATPTEIKLRLPFPESLYIFNPDINHGEYIIVDDESTESAPIAVNAESTFVQCKDFYGVKILKAMAAFHQVNIISVKKHNLPKYILNQISILEMNDATYSKIEKPEFFLLSPRLLKADGKHAFVPHMFSLRTHLLAIENAKLEAQTH